MIFAADPIDVHVGARIRVRRRYLGLSQTALADAIGITFQQVQKYERGANRISCSRLVSIADKLGVTPAWVFAEIRPGEGAQANATEQARIDVAQQVEVAALLDVLAAMRPDLRRAGVKAFLCALDELSPLVNAPIRAGKDLPHA